MTAHAVQTDICWEKKEVNHVRVDTMLAGHPFPGGDLLVLPELFDVGFTMNAALAADPSVDTADYLAGVARHTGCTVIAGHAALVDGRPANVASVFSPAGTLIARYAKCNPFSPAGEHLAYAAGRGPVVFDWAGLRVAPIICYDLRFPELFRAAAKLGAEMFVVIANWPTVRVDHWVTLARARAIENQAYVVAVNRVGTDPNCSYPGQSLVIGPKGDVIARAGDGVEVLSAAIDPVAVREWRRDFPALHDAGLL